MSYLRGECEMKHKAMAAVLALLLVTLALYNKPFEDPKKR